MQKRLLLTIAAAALVSAGQAWPTQTVLAAAKSTPSARAWVNPIKDEHLKPLPSGTHAAVLHHPLSAQEPPATAGRGGLLSPERMATAQTAADTSIQFLTRPYTTWHDITSDFDHCNPDYSTDGKVCRFDGSVGLKSNGVDPSFALGYAQTPGGRDYLYYDGHNGWDYSMYYENILASADGVVRIAGIDSINPCFGQTITVDHLNGFTSRYAHLSKIYVASGQSVSRGQVIAQSGNTGCSSGPHLHFGVYITSSWTAVDPWGWTGAGGDPWPSDPGNLWLTGYAQFPLPSAPSNVVAIPGIQSAQVSWTPPSFTGGTPLTSYTVSASPGGASVSVSGSTTSVVLTGLTNGTAYTFTVTALNSVSSGASSATSNAVTPNLASTFYFAEGSTNAGFSETLSILGPKQDGLATIDYFTAQGQASTTRAAFAAGKVTTVDVNAVLGANKDVSIKVTLPVPGVVERSLSFSTGTWHGSTDQVGVAQPATEWDFAEGSTLTSFNEYLTLQNPNPSAVTVNLNYFTSSGNHPVKTLTLPGVSRTTVEVFSGDPLTNVAGCVPGGTGASCGVGRNLAGVSVQVKSAGLPIVAERPFYVNGFSFGSGIIRDGHDAFGAYSAATVWNFAEGTTQAGFNEYLALQNPGGVVANVTLTFLSGVGSKTVRTLAVPANSRFTVPVFDPVQGVGPNVAAVSTQVASDQPIVVERPMYMVHDFGSGVVAGATDAVGSTGLSTLFGFSAGSTVASNHEYLTIENPGTTAANLSATYHTSGGPVVKSFVVPAGSRHTVDVSSAAEGAGPGFTTVGIVLSSDQPILVEKASYDANPATYGATVAIGFSPASF